MRSLDRTQASSPVSYHYLSYYENWYNQDEIDKQQKETEERLRLYWEARKNSHEHCNETCSNCNKNLAFEEWFCYCSLCPECYMATPEEELDDEGKPKEII